MTRQCFFSLDVEEDFRSGVSIPEFKGVQKLPLLLPVLQKQGITATLFCTGEVLRLFPDTLREFYHAGHEIALHGFYDHVNMIHQSGEIREQRLSQHLVLFESTFGFLPKGFRAVQNTIDAQGLSLLEKKHLHYDSSLISCYPIGKKYIGYTQRAPRIPYYPSYENIHKKGGGSILEIPLSPLFGGVQLQGRWIQKLGTLPLQTLLHLFRPSLLSFSFHSWDLLNSETQDEYNSSFEKQLEGLLQFLKNYHYTFARGEDLYAHFSKN